MHFQRRRMGNLFRVSLAFVVGAGRLVLALVPAHPRAGWAEAARQVAEAGDAPPWPEFGNEGDAELRW